MNSSQTNFEKIRQVYGAIFEALERALITMNIDFYLIGAQSRDVWLNHLVIEKRTTTDIDFAIYVPTLSDWELLTAYLISAENFRQDPVHPYRFYLDKQMVDLVPYGGLEHNGEVHFGEPPIQLSVYGCREVTADAEVFSGKYKVISPAGLCILKLIAFNEKPDWRQKDWDDFKMIMFNYGEIAGEKLYTEEYTDLFDSHFDFATASARMLGRQMRSITKDNPELKAHILEILQAKVYRFTSEEINQMFRQNPEDHKLLELKLIDELMKGIAD